MFSLQRFSASWILSVVRYVSFSLADFHSVLPAPSRIASAGIDAARVRFERFAPPAAGSARLRIGSPEAPLAALERFDCLLKRRLAEVRPERLGKHEFSVRRLPQHEIGEPQFT